MNWSALWIVGGAGFFRAFVGWFKNSVEDGEIQNAEWKKLVTTFAIYLTIGIIAVVGGKYEDGMIVEFVGIAAAFMINELWNAISKKVAIKKAIALVAPSPPTKKAKKK